MSGDGKHNPKNSDSQDRTDILVIEDDPDSRKEIKAALDAGGFHVVEAESGVHSFRIIERKKWTWVPAAVLVDLVMPEVSGYDVVRRIAERYKERDVPIVVVSRLATPDDILEAQFAGADVFVVKPFQPSALVEAVKSCIEGGYVPAEGKGIRIQIIR